jgi:anti-sigma B factor antagonist
MDRTLRRIRQTLVLSFGSKVNLEGETSLLFKEKLKGLIGDGALHVIVDLSNVGFVDSQGLGALISCLKVLRQSGGTLTLSHLSEPVEAVLRITRLIRVFDVAATVDEALQTVEGRRPSAVGSEA